MTRIRTTTTMFASGKLPRVPESVQVCGGLGRFGLFCKLPNQGCTSSVSVCWRGGLWCGGGEDHQKPQTVGRPLCVPPETQFASTKLGAPAHWSGPEGVIPVTLHPGSASTMNEIHSFHARDPRNGSHFLPRTARRGPPKSRGPGKRPY